MRLKKEPLRLSWSLAESHSLPWECLRVSDQVSEQHVSAAPQWLDSIRYRGPEGRWALSRTALNFSLATDESFEGNSGASSAGCSSIETRLFDLAKSSFVSAGMDSKRGRIAASTP